MKLLVHPKTDQQLQRFVRRPSHAVLLVGPAGSGKAALARQLAEGVLGLEPGALEHYAYHTVVRPGEGRTIGIEAVRVLDHFFSQRVPSKAAYNRAVIIEDSQAMTREAQNALLKLLEEPPEGSLLILTASHTQALLPTLRSRAQLIDVQTPGHEQRQVFFAEQGFATANIGQAEAMSGGLPGLMSVLLSDDDHPLRAATDMARQLLSSSPYERLQLVDTLSKQRDLATDTLFILQQMADVSLLVASGVASQRWQRVLAASYRTAELLAHNAQPKLALIELMLAL